MDREGRPELRCTIDGIEYEGEICYLYWDSSSDKKQKQVVNPVQRVAGHIFGETINKTLDIVKSALENENCRKLFGSGQDPLAVLKDVLNGAGNYAYFKPTYELPNSKGYVTYGEVKKIPIIQSKPTLSLNFLAWADVANQGNDSFNAETLLHELGHLFNADGFGSQIKYDGPGASGNGKYNDWLIDTNCFGSKLASRSLKGILMRAKMWAAPLILIGSPLLVGASEPVSACEVLLACRRYDGQTVTIRGNPT